MITQEEKTKIVALVSIFNELSWDAKHIFLDVLMKRSFSRESEMINEINEILKKAPKFKLGDISNID